VLTGAADELFTEALNLAAQAQAQAQARSENFVWALNGGSTPAAFYLWCLNNQALTPELIRATHFTVSDERAVLTDSPESNFGNALRQLLDPLGVPHEHRHPWIQAGRSDAEAAAAYRSTLRRLAGPEKAYDLCFLGLGDDCHTASLFPQTPLLLGDDGLHFGSHRVPDKGWRHTITPAGLRACRKIIVMALGTGKANALHRVHRGPEDVAHVPAQLLKSCAGQVTWLLDEASARHL